MQSPVSEAEQAHQQYMLLRWQQYRKGPLRAGGQQLERESAVCCGGHEGQSHTKVP